MAKWPPVATTVLAAVLWLGCSSPAQTPVSETVEPIDSADSAGSAAAPTSPAIAALPEANPELLSDWGQLEIVDGRLVPASGVTPYVLNSALFSDYALKLRTVSVPEPAEYRDPAPFDFGVGTVITKTFYYPRGGAAGEVVKVAETGSSVGPIELADMRLIETRVLVRRADGWAALPYVWNDDQTQATLARTGDIVALTLIDADRRTDFPYVVPNVNQCAGCHATNHTSGEIVPIGPKARHLNTLVDLGSGPIDQLARWRDRGLLVGGPAPVDAPAAAAWSDETASIGDRARAYLDINCAHCHNRVGPADTSGLMLEASTELGRELGVCKPPIAAGTGTGGRLVGISPGAAEESIFVYRMQTDDPGAMMPELGRAVVHAEGVDLIAAWIDTLTGTC